MKLREDLEPEDVPYDSTTLIIIENKVYELETADDQELFGIDFDFDE